MQRKIEHEEEGQQTEPSARTPLLKSNTEDYQSDDASAAESDVPQDGEADHWHAAGNSRNPRNWTATFKWITVALVSFIEFMT